MGVDVETLRRVLDRYVSDVNSLQNISWMLTELVFEGTKSGRFECGLMMDHVLTMRELVSKSEVACKIAEEVGVDGFPECKRMDKFKELEKKIRDSVMKICVREGGI